MLSKVKVVSSASCTQNNLLQAASLSFVSPGVSKANLPPTSHSYIVDPCYTSVVNEHLSGFKIVFKLPKKGKKKKKPAYHSNHLRASLVFCPTCFILSCHFSCLCSSVDLATHSFFILHNIFVFFNPGGIWKEGCKCQFLLFPLPERRSKTMALPRQPPPSPAPFWSAFPGWRRIHST